ncbi:hypothetical protein SCHPADRAFT_896975 [Schizopora paradoxa]|uniref:Uncharacterized protein n=1 Tax=Schizopora paradoxa TaxID=27342 RepID=A0A0H2RI54_9AGAM|nr:hypothetical protein SCHPADRAFT_896975 [Schizopora paradoxa]
MACWWCWLVPFVNKKMLRVLRAARKRFRTLETRRPPYQLDVALKENAVRVVSLPDDVDAAVRSVCAGVDAVALDVECVRGTPVLVQLASKHGIALCRMSAWNGNCPGALQELLTGKDQYQPLVDYYTHVPGCRGLPALGRGKGSSL